MGPNPPPPHLLTVGKPPLIPGPTPPLKRDLGSTRDLDFPPLPLASRPKPPPVQHPVQPSLVSPVAKVEREDETLSMPVSGTVISYGSVSTRMWRGKVGERKEKRGKGDERVKVVGKRIKSVSFAVLGEDEEEHVNAGDDRIEDLRCGTVEGVLERMERRKVFYLDQFFEGVPMDRMYQGMMRFVADDLVYRGAAERGLGAEAFATSFIQKDLIKTWRPQTNLHSFHPFQNPIPPSTPLNPAETSRALLLQSLFISNILFQNLQLRICFKAHINALSVLCPFGEASEGYRRVAPTARHFDEERVLREVYEGIFGRVLRVVFEGVEGRGEGVGGLVGKLKEVGVGRHVEVGFRRWKTGVDEEVARRVWRVRERLLAERERALEKERERVLEKDREEKKVGTARIQKDLLNLMQRRRRFAEEAGEGKLDGEPRESVATLRESVTTRENETTSTPRENAKAASTSTTSNGGNVPSTSNDDEALRVFHTIYVIPTRHFFRPPIQVDTTTATTAKEEPASAKPTQVESPLDSKKSDQPDNQQLQEREHPSDDIPNYLLTRQELVQRLYEQRMASQMTLMDENAEDPLATGVGAAAGGNRLRMAVGARASAEARRGPSAQTVAAAAAATAEVMNDSMANAYQQYYQQCQVADNVGQ
ncbi:hypothetical protein HDU97_009150, partial [Phlyctochytrium planicorne]